MLSYQIIITTDDEDNDDDGKDSSEHIELDQVSDNNNNGGYAEEDDDEKENTDAFHGPMPDVGLAGAPQGQAPTLDADRKTRRPHLCLLLQTTRSRCRDRDDQPDGLDDQ